MKRPVRSRHLLQLLIFSLILTLQSCLLGKNTDNRGALVSYEQRRASSAMPAPKGFAIVPGGTFLMGPAGPNITATPHPVKERTVEPFWMKETPTTNSEYLSVLKRWVETDVTPLEEDPLEDSSVMSDDDEPDAATSPSGEALVEALYPSRSVWKDDLQHEMADHMVDNYLFTPEAFIECSEDDIARHPYANYPVVGLTALQCEQFLALLSEEKDEFNREKGLPLTPAYRLPTAEQYTYAARGGKELAQFPWGGPYLRDPRGHLRANFKPNRGNLGESGYSFTSPVKNFDPNEYGLHDMAGNVAEWTSTHWDEQEENCPWRVIMGGSWKDIAPLLETGRRDFELETVSRSFIGFRPVMPYVGPLP